MIKVNVGDIITCYTIGHPTSGLTGKLERICDTEDDKFLGLDENYGMVNGFAVNLHNCARAKESVIGTLNEEEVRLLANKGGLFSHDFQVKIINNLRNEGFIWDKKMSISAAGVIMRKDEEIWFFGLDGEIVHDPKPNYAIN